MPIITKATMSVSTESTKAIVEAFKEADLIPHPPLVKKAKAIVDRLSPTSAFNERIILVGPTQAGKTTVLEVG